MLPSKMIRDVWEKMINGFIEYEKRYFQAISRLKNLGEADNTLDTYSSGQFREKRS